MSERLGGGGGNEQKLFSERSFDQRKAEGEMSGDEVEMKKESLAEESILITLREI